MLCWVYVSNRTSGYVFRKTRALVVIEMEDTKLVARFNDSTSGQTLKLCMENSLELNQWHYVGASYDDVIGNASLWINGTRVKQKNFGDGLTLASDVFDVKRMVSGINFKGRISAMQVYNYSLTSEDINALKYATFGPGRNV